jgi:aminopeptidase-like protein
VSLARLRSLPSETSEAPACATGAEIFAVAEAIFPICRSIAGEGVRETLRILGEHLPLERCEVPTGTRVLDWEVPKEWAIREAFIEDMNGNRILDFRSCNLAVLNYSIPVDRIMHLEELKEHIYTLPDQPDVTPYRTSYYAPHWGFCMPHLQMAAMAPGPYHVRIDSELKDGNLTYGEYVHRGETEREFLLTTHICHPSMANDNCSGLALLTLLARDLSQRRSRYTYRFLFAPGTIGALAWLAANEDRVKLIDHGLVISCVGDNGGPSYKRSRRHDAFIDRTMAHVLRSASGSRLLDFSPYGYDERQFCSPGFNLPVGLFQRSSFATFPEYHTSADNLDFIRPEYIADSYRLLVEAIDIVERDWTPLNLFPKGEPQLGRRGLYGALGGDKSASEKAMAMLWVLNLADGSNSLLAIAERSGLPFNEVAVAADLLREHGLLAASEAA